MTSIEIENSKTPEFFCGNDRNKQIMKAPEFWK
jgi:hypothetical protein